MLIHRTTPQPQSLLPICLGLPQGQIVDCRIAICKGDSFGYRSLQSINSILVAIRPTSCASKFFVSAMRACSLLVLNRLAASQAINRSLAKTVTFPFQQIKKKLALARFSPMLICRHLLIGVNTCVPKCIHRPTSCALPGYFALNSNAGQYTE